MNVSEEQKLLLADAQTSGGLLLCVADRNLAGVLARLRAHGALSAARIGRIVRSSGNRILVVG
ncbi:MAG TPA: AIR synthase-related protein [Verrucomicrobiota bacterium]|nr:AIR synthase-related protein [Verrucomicrobiota bacterium]